MDIEEDLDKSLDLDTLLNKYRKVIEKKSNKKPKISNEELERDKQLFLKTKFKFQSQANDNNPSNYNKNSNCNSEDDDQYNSYSDDIHSNKHHPQEYRYSKQKTISNLKKNANQKSIDKTPQPRYSPAKHPYPIDDKNLSNDDFDEEYTNSSPYNVEFCINPS